MKACILMGSPRKTGNTAALLEPFREELEHRGTETETVWLYDREIRPCVACRSCQRDWTIFGCPQRDDGQALFDLVLGSELVVLATPIYAWYCTPPMKALLDRLVYGMNKYYGEAKGPALLRRGCAVTAATPACDTWVPMWSGTWAMEPYLWMERRRIEPGCLHGKS